MEVVSMSSDNWVVTAHDRERISQAVGMELNNQTGILQLLSSVNAINFKPSSKK
jgi:lipopolysaccharide export system protein LptC